MFSLAYSAGPEVLALAEDAYRRFAGENALNVDAFPSLRRMQEDVVAIVRDWLGGPQAAGYMTTGGPEPLDNIQHPPDREHYVSKQIRPVAEPVLATLGLDFDTVVGDGRQGELPF